MTAYQAACIAKEAGAKRLLLTHFWGKEKLENYLKEAQEVFTNTAALKEQDKILL